MSRPSSSVSGEQERARESGPLPTEQTGSHPCLREDRRSSNPPSSSLPLSSLPPSHRSLAELDSFLVLRLMRLEITMGAEALEIIDEARLVRDAISGAGKLAGASAEETSCDRALIETLRGVYAWIFGVLDAIFLRECVRPLPKRLATEMLDHGASASMRSLLEPSLQPLESILVELTRACLRLARPR